MEEVKAREKIWRELDTVQDILNQINGMDYEPDFSLDGDVGTYNKFLLMELIAHVKTLEYLYIKGE